MLATSWWPYSYLMRLQTVRLIVSILRAIIFDQGSHSIEIEIIQFFVVDFLDKLFQSEQYTNVGNPFETSRYRRYLLNNFITNMTRHTNKKRTLKSHESVFVVFDYLYFSSILSLTLLNLILLYLHNFPKEKVLIDICFMKIPNI